MVESFGKGLGVPWLAGGRPASSTISPSTKQLLPVDSAPPPGPPGGNPPGPGEKKKLDGVGIIRKDLRDTVGVQDFILPNFGTVIAAFLIHGDGVVDGVAVNNLVWSIGATDGTNQWVGAMTAAHNQATTSTGRRGTTDEIIQNLVSSGVVTLEANFVSFIPDGIRLNVAVTDGGPSPVTVILFSDKSFKSASAGVIAHPTADAAVTTTVGFQAGIVLFAGHQAAFNDTAAEDGLATIGFGTFDGSTVLQCTHGFFDNHDSANADPRGMVRSDAIHTNGIGNQIEFGNVTATAFDTTSRNNGATIYTGYLALEFMPKTRAWTGVITSPTSTGFQTLTGTINKPIFSMIAATMITAEDTSQVDANAGAFAVSLCTKTSEICRSWAEEDAADPSDNQGLKDIIALNMPGDDGTGGFSATFNKFRRNGVRLNFSAVDGTGRLWPTLFIET